MVVLWERVFAAAADPESVLVAAVCHAAAAAARCLVAVAAPVAAATVAEADGRQLATD